MKVSSSWKFPVYPLKEYYYTTLLFQGELSKQRLRITNPTVIIKTKPSRDDVDMLQSLCVYVVNFDVMN